MGKYDGLSPERLSGLPGRVSWMQCVSVGAAMARTVKVDGLEWLQGLAEPIQGATTTELRDWTTLALSDRDSFVTDVRSMGFSETIVAEAVSVRDSAEQSVEEAIRTFWDNQPYRYLETPPEVEEEAAYVYDSARRDAWGRLHDWLAGRVIEVEDRNTIQLQLPLFTLSAPSAVGSTTEFTTSSSRTEGVTWSMSIVGSGLSDEGRVLVSTSATFQAAEGQIKVIFLPINVVLESILIREHGGTAIRGSRIDISSLRDQYPAPGLLLLAPTARPPLGHLEQIYPLSGDPSGAVATYRYDYQRELSATTKLGVRLHGLDIGIQTETKLETSVSLSFALPSGTDYRLFRCLDGHGVLWA